MRLIPKLQTKHLIRENTFIVFFTGNNFRHTVKKLIAGDKVNELVSQYLVKYPQTKEINFLFTDFIHVKDVYDGCMNEAIRDAGGSTTYFLQRYEIRAPHLYKTSLTVSQWNSLCKVD
jgi:hypothetical protein